jgi:hypothetical protein
VLARIPALIRDVSAAAAPPPPSTP